METEAGCSLIEKIEYKYLDDDDATVEEFLLTGFVSLFHFRNFYILKHLGQICFSTIIFPLKTDRAFIVKSLRKSSIDLFLFI